MQSLLYRHLNSPVELLDTPLVARPRFKEPYAQVLHNRTRLTTRIYIVHRGGRTWGTYEEIGDSLESGAFIHVYIQAL